MKMLSAKKTKASSSNPYQISSAEMIASNDDILTLILLRLPLKSLLKFKTVSKHWLSLITDPRFRPKHRSKAISGLFLRRHSGRTKPKFDFVDLKFNPHRCRAPFRSLTFVYDPLGIEIVQSCNGLLLCCRCRANLHQKTYFVYNPTTKHYTVLPTLGSSRENGFGVSLAFDPLKSSHYKVICITNSDPDLPDQYRVEIYSSETGPWRPSGRPFLAPSNVQFKNGVFWNGAIYWLSDWGDSLCFDVEEEKMRDVPMPSVVDEDVRSCRYFGESGGHLHLVEIYGSDNLLFDVFEMERDYSGWFVKYRVDLNPVAAAFPEMVRGYVDPIDLRFYAFSILCVVRNETDEDSFMVLHVPNKVIRYNFRDNSFSKLHDFAPLGSRAELVGDNSLEFECFDAYQFIESFACV